MATEIVATRTGGGKFVIELGVAGQWDCLFPADIVGDDEKEIAYVNQVLDEIVSKKAEVQ